MSPREPVVPEPDRDPQQYRLYRAEAEFDGQMKFSSDMPVKQARALIAAVRKVYDLQPVALVTVRKPRAQWGAHVESAYRDGFAVRSTLRVNRARARLDALTLLHEMAHAICDRYFGIDTPGHGRQFAGVAAWLYEKFYIMPSDAYRVILRRHGARMMSPTECSPQALRNWRSRHATV